MMKKTAAMMLFTMLAIANFAGAMSPLWGFKYSPEEHEKLFVGSQIDLETNRYSYHVAPDDDGGAFYTYCKPNYVTGIDIYAQHIDGNGDPLWGPNGVVVCNATNTQDRPDLVPDGKGGIYVAWVDYRTGFPRIFMQRLNATGGPQWGANGARLSYWRVAPLSPIAMVADGQGGAIVVWQNNTAHNYAQRVNATGHKLWDINNTEMPGDNPADLVPLALPDGSGGVYVAIMDAQVRVRHINASGYEVWKPGGLAGSNGCNMLVPPVPDGLGGFYVVTQYDPEDIWLLHYNSSGKPWAFNRVDVNPNGRVTDPKDIDMCSDGDNGVIIAWRESLNTSDTYGMGDIRVSRINITGAKLWGIDGIKLIGPDGFQGYPRITSDGDGGAVLSWQDERDGPSNIYITRINSTGQNQWLTDGVRVTDSVGDQEQVNIVRDSGGGYIVSWIDRTQNTLYTQRFYMAIENELSDIVMTEDDAFVNHTFTSTDPSGTTWSWSTNATWLNFNTTTAKLTGVTPDNSLVGTFYVDIAARQDLENWTVHNNFTVTVINRAPVFGDLPGSGCPFLTPEDSLFSYDIDCDDEGQGSTAYSIVLGPGWLSIDPSTGMLLGTPENDDVGSNVFRVQADDGNGGITQAYFILDVLNTNDAPVLEHPGTLNATQDVPFDHQLTATDVDVGDSLTWSMSSNTDWLSIQDGRLTGTAGNDDVGTWWANVTITDDSGASDSCNITVNVSNINDAPELLTTDIPDAVEDAFYSFNMDAVDIDAGDVLSWEMNGPVWMSINTSTGVISGTPSNFDVGTAALTVTVTDLHGADATRTFTITVVNTNDAPFWVSHQPDLSIKQLEPLMLQLHASDVDAGDTLAYGISSDPALTGLIVNASTGAVFWPGATAGLYTLNATATDGTQTIWQLFTINVSATSVTPTTNHPPVLDTIPDADTTVGQQLRVTVLWSDADAGDVMVFTLPHAPDGMVISADGIIVWVPTSEQVGNHSITVSLSDGKNTTTTTFTVRVTVSPVTPIPDQDTDTDTDGIPDWWEEFYGLDPNDPADALLDPDGDGITNLDEYKGKTNPLKSDLAPPGDDDDDDIKPDDDEGKDKDAWAANNLAYLLIAVAVLLLAIICAMAFLMARKGGDKAEGADAGVEDAEE